MSLEKGRRRLRDCLGPATRVLFVGINPGIRSAETGHHFAGYSNRFWKLLYESGLVPEPISYDRDCDLPGFGYGITNLVARATPGIGDLEAGEYEAGRKRLLRKIARVRPRVVVLVGVTLAKTLLPAGKPKSRKRAARGVSTPPAAPAKGTPSIELGLQAARLSGAPVFVLPNPSGRNANFSYREMLATFKALRRHLGALPSPARPAPRLSPRRHRTS